MDSPETVSTYRSDLLSLPDAAELPGAEASLIDARGVAWHYGNPLGEQRALATCPVVVDRSHRRVLKVSGPDAAEFLNNLVSQKLSGVADGFSASALDLNPQGRILHHADVTVHDGAFYLDVPSYQYSSLSDYLRRMVFWSDVSVDDADLAVLTLLGDLPKLDSAEAGWEATRTVDWARTPRTDLLVGRERVGEAVKTLQGAGVTLAGLMAFTAERVKAGEPELRADLDDRAIPHEAPFLIGRGTHPGAVHLDKGCYRGQETVARVENLGRSPRLLVMLQLDGSAPVDPQPGSPLTLAGRAVGRLGTVVHDAVNGPIALALVKRSALNAGQLTVEAEAPVAAAVDPDSLPTDEGDKAGRRAVESLRGSQ